MDSIAKANFFPLTHAASIGDDSTVLFLLETGANPEERDADGRSALSLAVTNGHLRSAAYLLEHGAAGEAVDSSGLSPVQYAAQNRLTEATNLLNDSTVKVTPARVQPPKPTPVALKRRSWLSIVRTTVLYLVGAGLAFGAFELRNVFASRSNAAIFDAITTNNISAVGRQLTLGTSANIRDTEGRSALLYAANNGRIDIVRILLKNRADPNLGTSEGISALKRSGIEHYEILDALLESGADPNRADSRGRSLLAYTCAKKGYTAQIVLLLKYKAKPNTVGENGPPLASLIEGGGDADPQAVGALLKAGADPNATDSASAPILVWAAEKGSLQVLNMLLSSGAKVSSTDALKRAALHAACRQLRLEAVKILLEHGADANQKDAEGNSPAMYAVSGLLDAPPESAEICSPILRILADHGARLDLPNHLGETPLQMLHERGVALLDSVFRADELRQ